MAICWLLMQSFVQVWRRALLFTRAGALTFTTILALVPLLVAIAAIFSVLPIAVSWQVTLQHFLFSHFVVSSGQTIQRYLAFFVARAWQLSSVSLGFLALNTFGLLFSIEQSLNAIWGVGARTWYRALGLYLVILGIIPALLILSLGLSFLASHARWLTQLALPLHKIPMVWPLSLSFIAYAVLFKMMPHTYVSKASAVVSALIAAWLFEGLKHGFNCYVLLFSNYERIYGAVAAVPLFFLWLYCCWVILLSAGVCGYLWQRHRGAK